jgi:N-dimethylarginine dimethylaminohydrolase
MKKADPKASVCISNEYGRLRDAIVGIGSGAYNGKVSWSDDLDGIVASDILEKENDSLVSILESADVKVQRPKRLTKDDIELMYGVGSTDKGYNQAFPRDNVAIVANDLIEFELNDDSRKTDIAGLYDILQERSKDSNICWYSTPHCRLKGTPDNYPALNGRDFVYLDDRMLFALSEENNIGTNSEGFRWMRNTFAFHDVMAVTLRNGLRYLGQAISVPRPGLAIVCMDGIVALPSFMKEWDIIEISLDEAKAFAADGLSIDEKEYVIGVSEENDNSRIVAELEKRGIKVHRIPFAAHMSLGGSVRSAVLPLRRDVE